MRRLSSAVLALALGLPVAATSEAPSKCAEIKTPRDLRACQAELQALALEEWHVNYRRLLTLPLGDLKIKANGGYSDFGGQKWGGAIATASLDRIEAVGDVRVGWMDKPLFRDLYFTLGTDEDIKQRIGQYVAPDSTADKLRRTLLWDAVKLNLTYGYGSTIKDPEGDENFEAKSEPFFAAVLSYEVPLSAFMKLVCDPPGDETIRPTCR